MGPLLPGFGVNTSLTLNLSKPPIIVETALNGAPSVPEILFQTLLQLTEIDAT